MILSFVPGESLLQASKAGPTPRRSEHERQERAAAGVESTFSYFRDGVAVEKKITETCVLLKLVSCGFSLSQVIGFDPMHAIGGVIKDLFRCLRGGRMTEAMLRFEQKFNG